MNFFRVTSTRTFIAFAAIALLACPPPPSPTPAQVYLDAVVGPSLDPQQPADCNASSSASWLLVGLDSTGFAVPMTVEDGTENVNATCTVSQTGTDAFNVQLQVHLSGGLGGAVTITSDPTMPVSSKGGSNLTLDQDTGGYGYGHLHATGCTLDYNRARAQGGLNVAPGRIWAEVNCPFATDPGTTKHLSDGGMAEETCSASAIFLFQHCQQ